MVKKILVPVDGSAYSNRAVEVAADLAKQYQSAVLIVHVIRNLSLPREILAMMAKGEFTESRLELLQDSADMMLENATRKFQEVGIADIKSEYFEGDPASKIAKYAEQNGADLIVMGGRGISSEEDSLLGGMARKLTNISKISCLVVK